MSKSVVLKHEQGFLSTLPVGAIIAWHKDQPINPNRLYTAHLPPGWVECNGQKLKDPESPFDGQVIPNLNGDLEPKNANSPGLSRKEQMFLRGGTTSGEGQDHQMQSHTHLDEGHTHTLRLYGVNESVDFEHPMHTRWKQEQNNVGTATGHAKLGEPSEWKAGTPLHGPETRPANMSVIWIMKVKQVVEGQYTPVVEAGDNAPIGAVYVNEVGNVGVGTSTPAARLHVKGGVRVEDGSLNFTDETAFFGSQPSGADTANQIGFGMAPGKQFAVLVKGTPRPVISPGLPYSSALLVWAGVSGMQGLHIMKTAGSPADSLVVEGAARFTGAAGDADTLTVSGPAKFTGTKTGYVTDVFVNASGGVLRTGDLVKLTAGGAVGFYGDNNRIPIAEVTLADSQDDPLVIGIVDREATPTPGEPDRRTDPDDPTSIPHGGELFAVTLGAYAHCKVDAGDAPIAVGDLLTSSSNPGHARKAAQPKIGSIIGKALEPLREGTGYIAVFVNIQ